MSMRMILFYLQEELNVLNQTSADINKLENELDVSWKKLFSSLMALYNHIYIKVYSTPKFFKNFVYIPPPQQCFAKYMYM